MQYNGYIDSNYFTDFYLIELRWWASENMPRSKYMDNMLKTNSILKTNLYVYLADNAKLFSCPCMPDPETNENFGLPAIFFEKKLYF